MSLWLRLVMLVLLLTTSLLGGLALYVGSSLRAWTLEVVDQELQVRADALVHEVHFKGHTLQVDDDDDDDLGRRGFPFQVETQSGSRLLGGAGTGALGVTGDGLTTIEEQGQVLRVLTRTFVPSGADEPLVLRVAAPLTAFSELATRFNSGLLVALLLAVLVGGVGAAVMARVLLAPLQRLTRDVAAINESSLEQPLDTTGLDPELSRLAVTFNGMLMRLSLAFAAQRTFVGRASHALRTPLASILSQAEVSLRRERTPEAYRGALEDIAASARDSARLAEGLLALTRADAAVTEQKTDFSAEALATEVQRLFSARAEVLGLRLTTDATPNLVVHATRGRVRELLDALLDNALRYTPRGGQVSFSVRREGGQVLLEVSDSGPGVQPAERERIFERFYRGSAASGLPGSGLGLSVVRALAEAEGAQVSVADAPSGGARFSVTLESPASPSNPPAAN